MLFITGHYKGEDCVLKTVSAKDLLKDLGVKPWDKNFSLDLHSSMKSWDPLNKTWKHALRIGKDPYFTCIIDGDEVEIRYGIRAPRKDAKTGLLMNTPKKLWFEGASMRMDVGGSLDFATFMYLHPSNENSPVRRASDRAEWMFDDKVGKAKEKSKKFASKLSLVTEINNEKDHRKLKRIAVGLRIKGSKGQTIQIQGAKDMTPEEIKVALCELAMTEPEFELQYRSSNVLLVGTAREAIDSGLLRVEGLGGGVSAYKWADGSELCRVSSGSEHFPALINHLHNEETFLEFMRKLDAGALQKNADHLVSLMKPEVSVSEMDAISLINKGLEENAIQRSGMQVVILNDWIPEMNALHNITDSANWMSELKTALEKEPIKINRLRKRLIDGPKEQVESKSKKVEEAKK